MHNFVLFTQDIFANFDFIFAIKDPKLASIGLDKMPKTRHKIGARFYFYPKKTFVFTLLVPLCEMDLAPCNEKCCKQLVIEKSILILVARAGRS